MGLTVSREQITNEALGLADPEKVDLIAKLEETLHLPADIDISMRKEAISRLDYYRKSALELSRAKTIDEFIEIR